MARDGHHVSADFSPSTAYPEPRHSQSNLNPTSASPVNYSQGEKMRYRDSSPSQRLRMDPVHIQNSRQPINDAVTSAVGRAEGNDAIPPEIVSQLTSQITANVLQHLQSKGTNLDGAVPPQSSTDPAAVRVTTNGVPDTSSVHSPASPSFSNRNVHTPPSPHGQVDESLRASPTSPTKTAPAGPGRATPEEERRSGSRNSRASHSDEILNQNMERPKPTAGLSNEVTTLEKIWGRLFDENGPTPRLGQFLRGLALHLIEDYEPKHSLVITPTKMQKFYEDTKLTAELYPWKTVFDDQTSSISRLYRGVEAQHHLVQDKFDMRPDIPGLTPVGFERWSILMLLAHPDQEFERLQKAVLDMPVCNYNDRKERFPKEISRRLFPTSADPHTRERLRKVMATHCNINLADQRPSDPDSNTHYFQKSATVHRADSMASATSSQSAAPHHNASEYAFPVAPRARSAERQQSQQQPPPPPTMTAASSEDAIEEEDEVATPQPIERERKPYSTQPGGGRNFDTVHRSSTPPGTRFAGPPPTTVAPSSNKLGRSASVASSSSRSNDHPRPQPHASNPSHFPRPAPNQPVTEASPMPDASSAAHPRTNSILSHHQTSGRPTRRRSPSVNTKVGDYRRADAEGSLAPNSYHHYASSPSSEAVDDSRRFREYERPYPPDRHDHHRASMHEMQPRDRDARPRYQSGAGYNDPNRGHYSSDEDYYRSTGGRPLNGYDAQQYYR